MKSAFVKPKNKSAFEFTNWKVPVAQNLGIYAYYSNVKIKLKEDIAGISMSVEKGAKGQT